MIRFNRAIAPFSVLSFDLDDTLYNNHPIIKAAVAAQQEYLAAIPAYRQQGTDYWQRCRAQAVAEQPELADNVTLWRKRTLRLALAKLGFDHNTVEQHANAAYAAFANARSNITVADEVIALLDDLAQHYTLIAITNGNVEIERFNLKNKFSLVLQAGINGKAKPDATLFTQAADYLQVAKSEILHIGDNLDSDVQGANNAGCQSVWLNNQNAVYRYQGLPDIEITSIDALRHLIKTNPDNLEQS